MTATATDTGIDPALDFEPQLPCELRLTHRLSGSQDAAVFLVRVTCGGCDRLQTQTICLPCWEYAAPPHTLQCARCLTGNQRRDECWTILRVIGGA